jgi:ATP-dependent DNA ligase
MSAVEAKADKVAALVIFQFDLLHVDGEDPSALPLVERKAS